MIMQNLTYLCLMLCAVLMLASCQPHDPFCFDHPHGVVVVRYDWSKAPDAAGNVNGTRVSFYRAEDGTHATTANFSGMEGGVVHLSEGSYDVISYNSNTDKLRWRGDKSLATLETYTRDASLTEDLPGFSFERIPGLVLTPNRLWSGRKDAVWAHRNDTTFVTLTPLKATYEVIWEVTGIRGADRVTACAVSLSGVGGSLMLDDWSKKRNESLMSGVGRRINHSGGNAKAGNSAGGFRGEFEVFGCNFIEGLTDERCPHTLTIYCWSGGGNILRSFDVTGQFHTVVEDRKIYIRIDGDFDIPTGGESDGGFNPDVDDWGEVNEDIIL